MAVLPLLFLAALAVGSPVASIQDYVKALDKRQSINSQDFDALKFYAQHAAAAYCNSDVSSGTAITCGGECPDLESDGVTAVSSFVGSSTGIGAYVGVDHARGEIVLGIRGSNNIRNFITDIEFAKVDCGLTSDCEVHDGFANAWDEISGPATSAIDSALGASPGYRIVVSGHSLGGAVATLAAAYLRQDSSLGTIDVYTYGSPRVGNAAFVNYVDAQPGAEFRVTHLDDPVPRLPPMLFDYSHTSPEYWLSDGDSDTVDYQLSDIQVCLGINNADCNAGTSIGLDIDAHLHYLEEISGCARFPLFWRRKRQSDVSDGELAARLSKWAVQDQDYASSL